MPFNNESFNNESPEEVANVIAKVRRITYETLCWENNRREHPQQDTFKKRIGESIELKPGIFGFKIDLRKLFRS